jgi:hypothetical protein
MIIDDLQMINSKMLEYLQKKGPENENGERLRDVTTAALTRKFIDLQPFITKK